MMSAEEQKDKPIATGKADSLEDAARQGITAPRNWNDSVKISRGRDKKQWQWEVKTPLQDPLSSRLPPQRFSR